LGCEFREFEHILPGAGAKDLLSIEAGQPVFHVGGVLYASLFAVIDDVDADGCLPGHDVGYTFVDAGVELLHFAVFGVQPGA
jgi:hypothetical protein